MRVARLQRFLLRIYHTDSHKGQAHHKSWGMDMQAGDATPVKRSGGTSADHTEATPGCPCLPHGPPLHTSDAQL